MKRKGSLALLFLLVLALTAAPAVAGTVLLDQTINLTVTVADTDSLALSSFAQGIGVGSVTQGTDSATGTGNPAIATLPTGPYLATQAVTFANKSTVTMSQYMQASAPDAVFGYTSQQTINDALFTFKAKDAGLFTTVITNAFNQLFSVTNPAGFAAFTSVSADSNLFATLTDTTNPSNFTQTIINLLSFPVDNGGVPLDNVSSQVTQSNPFAMVLAGVARGDIISLELSLNSTLDGGSDGNGLSEAVLPPPAPVPVPPSILLLGSGLMSIILIRRRRQA